MAGGREISTKCKYSTPLLQEHLTIFEDFAYRSSSWHRQHAPQFPLRGCCFHKENSRVKKTPTRIPRASAKRRKRQYVRLHPQGPFSDGVLVGDTLYLAGRIGL